MAIKAYIGLQGHGKTYEVVSVVILNALRDGRRVVSNIAGLNYDGFVELLTADGVSEDLIGDLVCISHDEPMVPNFWRTDQDDKLAINAFIQPGDVLVLDEVWRFWDGFSAKDMSSRVKNFFRMHRQFVDPKSGFTCEIAFICQDINDISRAVRGVIEETYAMEKLTALGSSTRYRVDVFRKTYVRRKPLRQIQRTYEEKYFPLYKSHSQAQEGGAGPREQSIDTRGNIFKGKVFLFGIPIGIAVLIWANWTVYKYFTTPPALKGTPAASAPGSAPVAPASPPRPPESEWRIVGYFQGASALWVELERGGQYRRERAAGFQLEPSRMVGKVDGVPAAQWTGVKAVSSGPGGAVAETMKGGGR